MRQEPVRYSQTEEGQAVLRDLKQLLTRLFERAERPKPPGPAGQPVSSA
jgi:hypothetical protein